MFALVTYVDQCWPNVVRRVVRGPFYQLFTINVNIDKHVQVPAVYILMYGKNVRDYEHASLCNIYFTPGCNTDTT